MNDLKAEFTKHAVNGYLGSFEGADSYAYLRASSERQVEEGSSFPRQILNIGKAALRENLRVPFELIFFDDGYTKEEVKMMKETQKIMGEPIKVTATTVRVPVIGGHSESVNIEFEKKASPAEVREILAKTAGVVVQDDPKNNIYPMPINAHEKDDVFVGRIRRDETVTNGINLWIVSDNIRKGAATNAVQIAEVLALGK